MNKKAFHITFNLFHEVFQAEGIEDTFILFDNLVEVIEKYERVNISMFDSQGYLTGL